MRWLAPARRQLSAHKASLSTSASRDAPSTSIRPEPCGPGAAEDSRIYLSLQDFESWTGVQPSTIEIAASGSPEEVNASIQQLAQALPAADVRPVRQIMEGEARVLGKTRATLLAAAALIIADRRSVRARHLDGMGL